MTRERPLTASCLLCGRPAARILLGELLPIAGQRPPTRTARGFRCGACGGSLVAERELVEVVADSARVRARGPR